MSVQATQEHIEINGVNVTKMGETVQAVKDQPGLAQFKFRAHNRWQKGGHNRIKLDGFFGTGQEIERDQPFQLDADEPEVLLGTDKGANPAEYLLTALSSCMTTSMAYHAAAQGIEIESIESDYEGDIDLHGFLDLDPTVRKGFEEIRVRFKVKADADKDKLKELVKHSPMYDAITRPTPVKIEFVTE